MRCWRAKRSTRPSRRRRPRAAGTAEGYGPSPLPGGQELDRGCIMTLGTIMNSPLARMYDKLAPATAGRTLALQVLGSAALLAGIGFWSPDSWLQSSSQGILSADPGLRIGFFLGALGCLFALLVWGTFSRWPARLRRAFAARDPNGLSRASREFRLAAGDAAKWWRSLCPHGDARLVTWQSIAVKMVQFVCLPRPRAQHRARNSTRTATTGDDDGSGDGDGRLAGPQPRGSLPWGFCFFSPSSSSLSSHFPHKEIPS